MRRAEHWQPTKFELTRGGTWRASRTHVPPASRLMAERVCRSYVSLLSEHARGRLLDLGCGTAPLYGAYRQRVDEVVCADWLQSVHVTPHIDVSLDLTGQLPFRSDVFDTVLFTDVLEHLPYPDRAWSEIGRVLKPGGILILGVPFQYWLHEQPHDYHRYSEHRLRLFCADHGFDVLSLAAYGQGADVLLDVAGKILAGRRMTRPLARLSAALSRLPPRTAAGAAMPLGYALAAVYRGPTVVSA